MVEIWKEINNWEGFYEVSNLGQVRSVDRNTLRNGKVVRRRGKLLSLNKPRRGKQNGGYSHVTLHRPGVRETKNIHRLVAQHFVPNPDNHPFVNHKDNNRTNNRADNLEWVTPKENSEHASKLNLYFAGEECPLSKLKTDEVLKVRSKFADGVSSIEDLATEFSVHPLTIKRILSRKIWTHI